MDTALWVLVWVCVLAAVAYVAHYIIGKFFPSDLHTPALLIVGVILLIVLLLYVVGWPLGSSRALRVSRIDF